jgi:hypothetical protein
MRPLLLALGAIMAMPMFAATATTAAKAGDTHGVIELFTSQGCSSCPPADRIASALARQPDMVVLSMPVDYWDYLGWKDTLANPIFTKRQKAYAAARGDRNIYTPQMVVNGLVHVVGSDEAAINVAMRETQGQRGVLSVPVAIAAEGGSYKVSLGQSPGKTGEIWLLSTQSHADVAIGRGENTGHSVSYTNVVRTMKKLGTYSGSAQALTLSADDVAGPNTDGFAVIVQSVENGQPGAMLGAAVLSPARHAAL